MEPGSEVQIKNLKSRPDLNGEYGTVKEIMENGRIAVTINNDTISLSPDNLTMIKIFVGTTVQITPQDGALVCCRASVCASACGCAVPKILSLFSLSRY